MDDAAFQKNDSQKVRWSLIPWDALLGILHVLEFGAKRYGPDNWQAGAEWSRYWNALQRHSLAWWMGEKCDPDTGRSHLLHCGCCILFLAAYEMRGIGTDDRPKIPS
jgi:hypothetical protein